MKKLIIALCLFTTPAAAQIVIQTPGGEHHDRNDRDRDRERPNLHQDRRDDFRDEDRRDRDRSDDDPDVVLVTPFGPVIGTEDEE